MESFFEDANPTGIEQSGYGLINLRAGIEYMKVALAFRGYNLLGEKNIKAGKECFSDRFSKDHNL